MDRFPTDLPEEVSRVATWNWCAPCRSPTAGYAADIVALNADVLGIQEACLRRLRRTLRAVEADSAVTYHVALGPVRRHIRCGPPLNANYGNVLLSRSPIEDVEIVRYARGGSEPRGYLSATTTIAGHATRVFITHLAQGAQAEVRAAQIVELMRAVAGHDRVVVLADLNTDPFGPELRPLWETLRDVDPHSGPEPDPACTPTADASPHRKKFDYILLRGLTCNGFSVVTTERSDHDMVTGYLSPDGTSRPVPTDRTG
jgi:endonuclease/exonuclease/phosphatase family metal-dependent hydrolase